MLTAERQMGRLGACLKQAAPAGAFGMALIPGTLLGCWAAPCLQGTGLRCPAQRSTLQVTKKSKRTRQQRRGWPPVASAPMQGKRGASWAWYIGRLAPPAPLMWSELAALAIAALTFQTSLLNECYIGCASNTKACERCSSFAGTRKPSSFPLNGSQASIHSVQKSSDLLVKRAHEV